MKVKTLKWETTVNLGIFQSSLSTALSAPKMLYRIAPRWDEENNRKCYIAMFSHGYVGANEIHGGEHCTELVGGKYESCQEAQAASQSHFENYIISNYMEQA